MALREDLEILAEAGLWKAEEVHPFGFRVFLPNDNGPSGFPLDTDPTTSFGLSNLVVHALVWAEGKGYIIDYNQWGDDHVIGMMSSGRGIRQNGSYIPGNVRSWSTAVISATANLARKIQPAD